jgi:phage repressor protein C with HTH and peptisase S24 domain
MITHAQLWSAIDALAAQHQLTPAGLAQRAGLNNSTFNRAKRTGGSRKEHWPSVQTLALILRATDTTLGEFATILRRQPSNSIKDLDSERERLELCKARLKGELLRIDTELRTLNRRLAKTIPPRNRP